MDAGKRKQMDNLFIQAGHMSGGGIELAENFFDFLRRETKVLHDPDYVKAIQNIAMKHITEIQEEEKAKAAKAQAKSTKKAKKAGKKKKESQSAAAAAKPPAGTPAATPAAPTPDSTEKDEEPKMTPVENGGQTDRYRWTQSLKDANVYIPLPAGTRGKELIVEFEDETLDISFKRGGETIVKGTFSKKIKVEDSTWTIDRDDKQTTLVLDLAKVNQMEWWPCILEGDQKIDTAKITPEEGKLSDLDGSTRQTVEQMMYNQRQQKMGKPTIEEERKEKMLAKFMKMHPEMDFSNAKIG